VLAGDSLVVNADASGGSLTVQVFDAAGLPLEAESSPIDTNSLRHQVN
jgi:hypothetical protein